MAQQTPRLRWQKALRSTEFPAGLRVVRGTLLALLDEVTPDGELCAWRDQLAVAAGLPSRTLDRHLQRAVDAGWLVRKVSGGNGRRAVYRTAIPSKLCATNGAQVAKLCATYSCATPGSCAPPGGELNKESASDSERVALDDHRGRRRTHDGESVSPLEHSGKYGSNGDPWQPTPVECPSSDSTKRVVA